MTARFYASPYSQDVQTTLPGFRLLDVADALWDLGKRVVWLPVRLAWLVLIALWAGERGVAVGVGAVRRSI